MGELLAGRLRMLLPVSFALGWTIISIPRQKKTGFGQ